MASSSHGLTLPELYVNTIQMFKHIAVEEDSRNGPVLTVPMPYEMTLINPNRRVLYDKTRCANPFFHVMETIWMLAGSNDVRWLEQFNKRYREYAEPETDLVWAAYGHRWRLHFGMDQVRAVIKLLRKEPTTRRAVIAMWDPVYDMDTGPHNDLPCNTHIYFRVIKGQLHMTVCNRSNDLIWGALGANVVHMTMLQELIASACGLELGRYRVYTNNLHVYRNLPNCEAILATHDSLDAHANAYPLLRPEETYEDFLKDAEEFIQGDLNPRTLWFKNVAMPMQALWRSRDYSQLQYIRCEAWRPACQLWLEWKDADKAAKRD